MLLVHAQLRGQQWHARQPQPDQAAQGSTGGASDVSDMELSLPTPPSKDEEMPAASQLGSHTSNSLLRVQGSLTAAAERADQVRLGRSSSLSGSPEAAKDTEGMQAMTPTSRPAVSEQITAGSRALDRAGDKMLPETLQAQFGADVTVATQAAFSELNGMFTSSPLGAGQQLSQGLGSVAAGMQAQQAAASAADVTMVTRNTFDSVNSMFQGALPQNCAWPQRALGNARDSARMSLAGPVTARLLAGGELKLLVFPTPLRGCLCRLQSCMASFLCLSAVNSLPVINDFEPRQPWLGNNVLHDAVRAPHNF